MGTLSTTAGVESQDVILTGVDSMTNRENQVPRDAVLTKVSVKYWATDATPVNGKHQCLMFFQPAATAYSTPIASYLSNAHPLTEEAVQIRQNVMSKRLHMNFVVSGAAFPLRWHCFWKGRRLIREGDDVVISLLDATGTTWNGLCDYTYIN